VTLAGEEDGRPALASVSHADRAADEVARLRGRLAEAEATAQALRDRCEDLEEDRAHLGRLCVASAQLHASGSESESLRNLQDVLVNLVGSEQIAIWTLARDGRTLELRASLGIDSEPWQRLTLGQGRVGRTAASGEIAVFGGAEPGEPSACAPLLMGEKVVGAVAVFRPLAHRTGFGPEVQDVLRLVSRQAAFALYAATTGWRAWNG
jgi:GAF domain-containing protein